MIIIFDQAKSHAYNWDNTVGIYVYNNHIIKEGKDGNCNTLAQYSSEELAREALEMVISAIANGFPVIYMPYEDKVREHLNNKRITNQNRGAKCPFQRRSRKQERGAK